MQFFAKSVFIMAVRRKTRRGRRRNRLTPSKRKLFVPATVSDFGTEPEGSKWKANARCLQTAKIAPSCLSRGNFKMLNNVDAQNSPNKENHGYCEFSFSHWWNSTPKKKGQKLVRPPYTPVAPNNSTQYIIDDRVECGNVFRGPMTQCEAETYRGDSDSNFVNDRVGLDENCSASFLCHSKDSSSNETPQYSSETSDFLGSNAKSPQAELDIQSCHRLPETDYDSDYESPDDIDFFSFVQNDFLQVYEEARTESLSRLSKSDLISEITSLEKRFDDLQNRLSNV